MLAVATSKSRPEHIARGVWLEWFTVGYNSLEGVIALIAGFVGGSIALVGFGLDSVIEVTSGSVLLWRLRSDAKESQRDKMEATALKIVGVLFLALALYVGYEAISCLISKKTPNRSPIGIALAVVSLIVMPVLAKAKRRLGGHLKTGQ